MGIFDLFRKAPCISTDEVRAYIRDKAPSEYCLVDVRQPSEYQHGHLPGARLIPLGQLRQNISGISPDRTIIVYCRTGSRSNAAATLLLASGLKNVLNMSGGIIRYNGIVASGPPEAGMFCFPENLGPGQLLAVACYVEEGTGSFLGQISTGALSSQGAAAVASLAGDKKDHKERLRQLYRSITGQSPEKNFPAGVIELPEDPVMVGCVKVADALRWAKDRSATDILEMLMSLSANAYDLYLKLGRMVNSEEARRIFEVLAEEEHANIDRIARVFEGTL
ncbi:MAG: rhodanese-like domain-containing protein [Nitrospiraceae bacterium]|nr:rhodanese-like domain-containing protein [Nitrospiraceae bacterium]